MIIEDWLLIINEYEGLDIDYVLEKYGVKEKGFKMNYMEIYNVFLGIIYLLYMFIHFKNIDKFVNIYLSDISSHIQVNLTNILNPAFSQQKNLFIKLIDSLIINESYKYSNVDFQLVLEDEYFYYNLLIIQFYIYIKLIYELNSTPVDKIKQSYAQDVFMMKFLNNINLFSKLNLINCMKICLCFMKVPVYLVIKFIVLII